MKNSKVTPRIELAVAVMSVLGLFAAVVGLLIVFANNFTSSSLWWFLAVFAAMLIAVVLFLLIFGQYQSARNQLATANLFLKLVFSALIDVAFLMFWFLMQSAVGRMVVAAIPAPELDTFAKGLSSTFRVIFAVSTVVPVLFFLIGDLISMIRRISEELKRPID